MRALAMILVLGAGFWIGSVEAAERSGRLKLRSQDIAAKGTGFYHFDQTGNLHVYGRAKSWLLGTYKFDDRYQLDPSSLASKSYQTVGKDIVFDNLILRVKQVFPTYTIAEGRSKNGKVRFTFDTQGELIDILSIQFRADLMGWRFELYRG